MKKPQKGRHFFITTALKDGTQELVKAFKFEFYHRVEKTCEDNHVRRKNNCCK